MKAFVSQNKDGLKKLLLKPHLEPDKSVVLRVHKDVVDKWYHELGSLLQSYTHLPTKHKGLMYLYAELIALYLMRQQTVDWMTGYSSQHAAKSPPNAAVAEAVVEAIGHLTGPTARSAIVGKCYNYLTGKVEYVLEDGNHVPTDRTTRPEMPIDDVRLPECVLMLTDPQSLRDARINQINAKD